MSNAAFSPDGSSLGFLRPDGAAAAGPGQAVTLYTVPDLQECFTPGGAVRPPRSVPKRFLGADAGAGADDESNLSLEEKLRRERQRSLHVGVTSFTWLPDGRALFPQRGSLCIAGAGETPTVAVDKTASGASGSVLDAQPSKDGRWVAFVQEGEVYVAALPQLGTTAAPSSTPVQVTYGARERGWTHGEADYLSQEELDRYVGLWWSPCGRYIAFQETDDTHVPPFRIVHVGAEPADSTAEEVHRYPFAGCARNPAVRLAVVDVSGITGGAAGAASSSSSLPTRYLHLTDGDDAGIYIPRVSWAPDSSLIVQVFNRPQTCVDVVSFPVVAGFASSTSEQADAKLRGTLLLREVAPTGWFNVHDCLKFLPPTGLGSAMPSSPSLFTWASERTGFLHLYLYATDPEKKDGSKGSYTGPASDAETEAIAQSSTTSSNSFTAPASGCAAQCLGALTWGEEWQVETLEGVVPLGGAADQTPAGGVTDSMSNSSGAGWGLFFTGTADGPLQRHCYRLTVSGEEVAAALAAAGDEAAYSYRRFGAPIASPAAAAVASPATFAHDTVPCSEVTPTFARSFGPTQPYPVPGMQRVTSGSGFHTVVVSPCGRFLADTLSSLHASPSLSLYCVPPFISGGTTTTAAEIEPLAAATPASAAGTSTTDAGAVVKHSTSETGAADAAITVAAASDEDAALSPASSTASRSIADIAADSFANFIAFGAAKLEAAAAGFTSAASRTASRRQSAADESVGDEAAGEEGAPGSATDSSSAASGGASASAPATGLARFAPQRVSLGALGAVSVSTLSAFAAFVSPAESGAAADGNGKPDGESASRAASSGGEDGTDSSDDDEDGEGSARAGDVAAAIDAAVAAVQANAAAGTGAEEEPRAVRPHDVSRVLAAVVPLAVSGPYGGSAAAGDAAPCPGAVPIRLLMTCTGTLPQWTAGNPESLATTIEGLRARMMGNGVSGSVGGGRGRSGSFGADAAAAAARAALSRVVSPVSAASAALLDSVSHAVSQVSSAVSEAATRLTAAGLPSPSEVVKAAVAAVKTSGNGGAGAGHAPAGSPAGVTPSPALAAAAAAPPAATPASPAPLLVETLAADGTTPLYGALYIPDERKWGPGPYPTVVSVYGGPHVQRVRMEWSATADARAQALARAGILVAKFDNRGSFRRGAAFERALRLRMGTVEVDDQAAGVRWLVGCGLADPSAVGLCGWSYGGYMTLMCLARRPDVFHVGASGAPVTDWAGYDTAYTERYMGTPSSNAAGYVDSCVMSHVKGLAHSDLLLVHGLIDENVHVRHTYRLINALTRARVPYTFIPFPNERHVPRGKEDLEYMEASIQRYLTDNLRRRAAEAALAAAARATAHTNGSAEASGSSAVA